MAKIKWVKTRNNKWIVPSLPFINGLVIQEVEGKFGYWFYGSEFNTLKEAAKACIEYCKQKVGRNDYRMFTMTEYCGNIGYGKYIANREWSNYLWIEGGWNHTSPIANQPAIRFLESEADKAEKHAEKIQARHLARFLKAARQLAKGPELEFKLYLKLLQWKTTRKLERMIKEDQLYS